jgi:ATP-dependent Zn protease
MHGESNMGSLPRVTLLPRGDFLGVNIQRLEETQVLTKTQVQILIASLWGGHYFKDTSTVVGPQLRKITLLVATFVLHWAMGENQRAKALHTQDLMEINQVIDSGRDTAKRLIDKLIEKEVLMEEEVRALLGIDLCLE